MRALLAGANVSTTPGPNVCSATGSPVSRSVSCAGSRTAASTLRNSLGGLVGFLGRSFTRRGRRSTRGVGMGIDHRGRGDFAHRHSDGVTGERENVHIAVGSPHRGAAGFRTSHLEALSHSPGHRTVWARGAVDHRVQRCCLGGCDLARPGCGEGLRCRSARRSRTRRRERARRARRTPCCSRRARESRRPQHAPWESTRTRSCKGCVVPKSAGAVRDGQGRRTARRPTRVRRAGGLGVARVIASIGGARARWMCWQHTAEGWEGLVERHRPFVGWHLIPKRDRGVRCRRRRDTCQPPAAALQHALPDAGEQVPTLSWPIVGIFTFALALFGASTWAALTDTLPAMATIAASARPAIFVLFTVLHDASHYSISSHRWVNVAFGRRGHVLRLAFDLIQVVRVHPY